MNDNIKILGAIKCQFLIGNVRLTGGRLPEGATQLPEVSIPHR